MADGYIVHYYLGNKENEPYKLWIFAHDPEEASRLCRIQAGHRHGYSHKVTVTGVESESGEKFIKPVVKREPVPELSMMNMYKTIMETNGLISSAYKSLGKRHHKHGGLLKWF